MRDFPAECGLSDHLRSYMTLSSPCLKINVLLGLVSHGCTYSLTPLSHNTHTHTNCKLRTCTACCQPQGNRTNPQPLHPLLNTNTSRPLEHQTLWNGKDRDSSTKMVNVDPRQKPRLRSNSSAVNLTPFRGFNSVRVPHGTKSGAPAISII